MDLSKIIPPENVFIDISAPTKWRALQVLSSKAGELMQLDQKVVLHALEVRERLGSTGIGNGIAIPHSAVAGLDGPRGLIMRFGQPIDFEAIDDVPVDLAFLLLYGESARGEYLNVLAAVARRLKADGIPDRMRWARTADELYALFMAPA
ncbi:PTS sugar transporter subunit IIA [Rhizobium sp. BK251]|uniref:PTS sugar transporter subunit IIA n=1 Tax=Rhizobium sp. BK251 TaxID=2512125 RepID=UPI001050D027|nr:PTS sugar transporter subunit IIA [Rhizobium sp. BK251]TCL68250.1 phosphotransferase IIA-like nitrogen-regulatory protein PtsN [Rhizobium sp. BK251]